MNVKFDIDVGHFKDRTPMMREAGKSFCGDDSILAFEDSAAVVDSVDDNDTGVVIYIQTNIGMIIAELPLETCADIANKAYDKLKRIVDKTNGEGE